MNSDRGGHFCVRRRTCLISCLLSRLIYTHPAVIRPLISNAQNEATASFSSRTQVLGSPSRSGDSICNTILLQLRRLFTQVLLSFYLQLCYLLYILTCFCTHLVQWQDRKRLLDEHPHLPKRFHQKYYVPYFQNHPRRFSNAENEQSTNPTLHHLWNDDVSHLLDAEQ
jgi:hypothetical protein